MKFLRRWPAVAATVLAMTFCVSGCTSDSTKPKAGDPAIPDVPPAGTDSNTKGTKTANAGKGGAALQPIKP